MQTVYNFNRKDSISCDFKTRELDQCNFIFFFSCDKKCNLHWILKALSGNPISVLKQSLSSLLF